MVGAVVNVPATVDAAFSGGWIIPTVAVGNFQGFFTGWAGSG